MNELDIKSEVFIYVEKFPNVVIESLKGYK